MKLEEILKELSVNNPSEALRKLAFNAKKEADLDQFIFIYLQNTKNIFEAGPKTGKNSLNFAIEGFCKYVSTTSDLNYKELIVKLKLISSILVSYIEASNVEDDKLQCLNLSSTKNAMANLKKLPDYIKIREFLGQEINANADFRELRQYFGVPSWLKVCGIVSFFSLIEMAERILDTHLQVVNAANNTEKETYRPLILAESHDEDCAEKFILELKETLKNSSYTTIGLERPKQNNIQEDLTPNKHDQIYKNFQTKLQILSSDNDFEIKYIDPRPYEPKHIELTSADWFHQKIRMEKFTPVEFNIASWRDLRDYGISREALLLCLSSNKKLLLNVGLTHAVNLGKLLSILNPIIVFPFKKSENKEELIRYNTALKEFQIIPCDLSGDPESQIKNLQSFAQKNLVDNTRLKQKQKHKV